MMFTQKRNLHDLIERQKTLDEGKQDYRCKTTSLKIQISGKLGIELPKIEKIVYPSDHALRQLAGAHGFSAKQWQDIDHKECPTSVRVAYADLIEKSLSHRWGLKSTDSERLIRTQGNRMRAFMSGGYGVFNNSRALELMQKAFDVLDQNGAEVKVYDSWQTEDELCVRVIAPGHKRMEPSPDGGEPSAVYPGVYVGNSEIGTKRIYVKPLVLRLICSNGMMGIREDGAGMQRVHRGSMMILENDFNMALADALNLADSQVERFLGLTQQTVANPLAELAKIWKKNEKRTEFTNENFKLAEASLTRYIAQFGETKYSVVNALTEVAQTYKDANERLLVEEIAGEYALGGVS